MTTCILHIVSYIKCILQYVSCIKDKDTFKKPVVYFTFIHVGTCSSTLSF